MTFLDLKRTTLQKVFAITDGQVVNDDSTKEYLTALPAAANEGLQRLATVGRFLKRKVTIVQEPDGPSAPTLEEGEDGEKVIHRATGAGQNDYDLSKLLEDFYSLDVDGVYFTSSPTSRYQQGSWQMQGAQVLFLAAETEGTWTIWYNAYPPELTMDTEDDYELPLYPELAVLLPLYIASQIYKDDDIGVAVQYRNEFEIGLADLQASGPRGIQGGETWTSTKGWWDFN